MSKCIDFTKEKLIRYCDEIVYIHFTSNFVRGVEEYHRCLLKLLGTIFCTMYSSPATTSRPVSLPQRVRRANLSSIANCNSLRLDPVETTPVSPIWIWNQIWIYYVPLYTLKKTSTYIIFTLTFFTCTGPRQSLVQLANEDASAIENVVGEKKSVLIFFSSSVNSNRVSMIYKNIFKKTTQYSFNSYRYT